MYYNKVEICGVNTSELKVLSDAEKKVLLQRTKQGDKNARQEMRIVGKITVKHHASFIDICQLFGLCKM